MTPAARPRTLLAFSCPDRPGIVAAVGGWPFAAGGNILEAHQFDDPQTIIEQDVERITHQASAEDLVAKGRDIERRVLARAVMLHMEGWVLLNERKTVVFGD